MIAATLLGSNLLRFCDTSDGAEQKKPEAAVQAAEAAKLAPKANSTMEVKAALVPKIGGSVVNAGAYRVEIALHQRGLIEGQIQNADGTALADPTKAKLAVQANGKASGKERIQLRWEPAQRRFVGNARAKAGLAPGALDVELTLDGKKEIATLAQAAVLMGPEHGGAVMAAGEYNVELLANTAGDVDAHLLGADGAALAGGADLDVRAKLAASGGAAQEVALKWDPARSAFHGRAEAGVKLASGPVIVNVINSGVARVGGIADLTVAASATHGGRILLAGDYSVEVAAKDGLVLAYVADAQGKAVANADVRLQLAADGRAETRLTWDAPSASYRAKLAAGLDLATQPLRIDIRADGRAHFGGIGRLDADAKLLAKAGAATDVKANANANAKAGADAKLTVKAPEANAKAALNKSAGAQANVNLSAPKVNVTPPKVKAETKKSGSASGSAKLGFSLGSK
ncbi:MAG TPA: hypothetical protein VI072_01710 [Polyangiaceae bacterium]